MTAHRIGHVVIWAIAVGLVACTASAPAPSPSPPAAVDEAPRATASHGASGADWIAVNCSKLITIDDIAAICRPTRALASLVSDRSEGVVTAAFDLNPSTRSTCARTLKLEGGGVFLHVQVTDYSTVEALAKITDIWARSFPNDFRDGLYIHDLHQDWTRHDVESNKGRLSISVFETDQPGHAALCSPEHLIELVRRTQGRLP